MTIRAMVSLFAVGLTSVAFAACGSPAALSEDEADRLSEAQQEATEARELVADLTDDLASLESRMADLEQDAEAVRERGGKFNRRIEGLSERLKSGLKGVREGLSASESASASASANASSALAEARSAVQDLNVLRARYDEHLRRFHGGG